MPRMDATSPRAQKAVQQADARLANLLHLADALPEFAVSPAFGGAAGGEGGTVTDVLAQVHAEQEAMAHWLARHGVGHASTGDEPHFAELQATGQHAHRPYKELRRLVEEGHGALCESLVARDELAVLERLGGRYEWAQSVLGQCAL